MPKLYERMVGDLKPEEVAVLKGVTKENLVVELLADWVDDHEQCVGVKLNGVEVSFWWLSFEAASAFFYPNSVECQRARDIVLQVLSEALTDLS